MTRRLITQPSFNAVGTNQTATVDLAPSGSYHNLLLYITDGGTAEDQAAMEATISEIRIKVNGKVQRRFSARELFDINGFYGMGAPADGFLQIHFSEPWRRTAQGEDILAWTMGDVDTFQVEVDIGTNVDPALSILSSWEISDKPMGNIVKWRKFTQPVSAIGVVTNTNLPKIDPYYAMHCLSAVISDVEIKIDQEERFSVSLAEANVFYGNYGLVPNADWFHVSFDHTNRVHDALSMIKPQGGQINELRVDFTLSSATAFTLITETIGPRD